MSVKYDDRKLLDLALSKNLDDPLYYVKKARELEREEWKNAKLDNDIILVFVKRSEIFPGQTVEQYSEAFRETSAPKSIMNIFLCVECGYGIYEPINEKKQLQCQICKKLIGLKM